MQAKILLWLWNHLFKKLMLMDDFSTTLEQGKTSIDSEFNPFPGLRPFGIEESHLFFGREGQSEEVLTKLSENRFVAVIGASGTGKSSLIYCGLIPILYGGFIASAGSKWNIISSRPGSSPIDNLASAIAKVDNKGGEDIELKKSFLAALLRRSSLGLVEALKQIDVKDGNILLLVDQFEELFRYRVNRKGSDMRNESGAFVKLLIEAVNQTEVPVYIVLTMRSDFIGECSQFQELTSLINLSNYLIPQMTRSDFQAAVTGPVAVGGASIEPALVQELLNSVGDNPDQLPILQHSMMRTWDYWLKNSTRTKPITLGDYEAIGKMERALSEHANEAYDELDDYGKRLCEIIFKSITEKGSDNRGVRRPTRLEEIAEIAKAEVDDLIKVIEKFRVAGRSFITPSHEIPLNKDSIIDLSHESLMRIWNRLKVWVEEESAAVQMYNRLSEAAAMFQEGKTSLWRPPDLQLALNWEKKQQPTLSWAQRHNPAFERTMVFLHTSAKEYESEELNKIKLQKRALKRSRMIAGVLGVAAIISLGIMIYAQTQTAEAVKQKKLAVEKSEEAKKQKELAEQQKKFAEESSEEAKKQSKYAQEQSELAQKQKEYAEQRSIYAEEQRKYAVNQKDLADSAQKTAEKNAVEAKKQQEAAEKAREEANKRRMRSISQSMAVKSLQIYDDQDLKALLAYQAYVFNKKYEGPEHNPDVYAGLYDAMITLNSHNFNIYKGHTEAVNSIVFHPNQDIFYSSSSDGKVLRWDASDTTKKPKLILKNTVANKAIDISADGRWLAVGTNGTGLCIIDLKDEDLKPRFFPNLGKTIESLAFTKEGALIACSGKDLLEFNVNSGAGIVTGTADSTIISITISSDGKTVGGGLKNGKIILWDRSNGFKASILSDDPKNKVTAVAFSTTGNLFASGDGNGYL
jgi:energy-coupling factor transporter ATP-binding protein EcfA2/pyruvate/2-oxoglutarate dehydrogenase complex dihydrolipoamide acyltransferase (E2) component